MCLGMISSVLGARRIGGSWVSGVEVFAIDFETRNEEDA